MAYAIYTKEKMVRREEKDSLIACIKAVFLYGIILILLILTGSFEADAAGSKNIKYNNYYSRLIDKSRDEIKAMGFNEFIFEEPYSAFESYGSTQCNAHEYVYYDGENINDKLNEIVNQAQYTKIIDVYEELRKSASHFILQFHEEDDSRDWYGENYKTLDVRFKSLLSADSTLTVKDLDEIFYVGYWEASGGDGACGIDVHIGDGEDTPEVFLTEFGDFLIEPVDDPIIFSENDERIFISSIQSKEINPEAFIRVDQDCSQYLDSICEADGASINTVQAINSGKEGWSFEDVNGIDCWVYYKNGQKLTGPQAIEGNIYYFKEDTSMSWNEWIERNGNWYYFDENGHMVKDRWAKINDVWYYFLNSGVMAKGWRNLDDHWYYFKDDGSLMHNEVLRDENGDLYMFNHDYAITGWDESGTYYFNRTEAEGRVCAAKQGFVKGLDGTSNLRFFWTPGFTNRDGSIDGYEHIGELARGNDGGYMGIYQNGILIYAADSQGLLIHDMQNVDIDGRLYNFDSDGNAIPLKTTEEIVEDLYNEALALYQTRYPGSTMFTTSYCTRLTDYQMRVLGILNHTTHAFGNGKDWYDYWAKQSTTETGYKVETYPSFDDLLSETGLPLRYLAVSYPGFSKVAPYNWEGHVMFIYEIDGNQNVYFTDNFTYNSGSHIYKEGDVRVWSLSEFRERYGEPLGIIRFYS